MKKSIFLTLTFLACSMLFVSAQENRLVGIWTRANVPDGSLREYKMFTADGRLYGYYASGGEQPISTWFLSHYKILNQNTYEEQVFFHINLVWQNDLRLNYLFDDDDHLTTSFIHLQNNGKPSITTEQWVRVKEGESFLQEPDSETWEKIKQKALVQYKRVPKSGQTVEQMADSLYQAAQEAMTNKETGNAMNDLIIRAELDTTNMAWQNDVLKFFDCTQIYLSIAAKYARRVIYLGKDGDAATYPDVAGAYKTLFYVYTCMKQEKKAEHFIKRSIEVEQANGKTPDEETAYKWLIRGLANLQLERSMEAYNCGMKAAEILETIQTNDLDALIGCYFIATEAAKQEKNFDEVFKIAKRVIALCADNKKLYANMETANTFTSYYYGKMIEQKLPNAQKEYQEFIKDKLFVVAFENISTLIPHAEDLKGEYFLMKYMNWDFNSPFPVDASIARTETTEMILWKDGIYTTLQIPDSAKDIGAQLKVRTVGKVFKQKMAKSWKKESKLRKK